MRNNNVLPCLLKICLVILFSGCSTVSQTLNKLPDTTENPPTPVVIPSSSPPSGLTTAKTAELNEADEIQRQRIQRGFSEKATVEDTTSADVEAPSNHVWQYLKKFNPDAYGYGLYTYVLTGRNNEDKRASMRYKKLIEIITASTASADSIPAQIDKNQLNLFLIPAKTNADKTEADQELAKDLLTAISLSSKQDFSGPGPYLFSVLKPIEYAKSGSLVNMLYVDLSAIHEGAFAELVPVYKKRITGSKLSGTQALSSLKISLLSSALIAEDSISIIKFAKASLIGIIE